MLYQPRRSPLTYLGLLLAAYLTVPVLAFAVRFAGSHDRGFDTPGLWGALRTSAETATISTVLVAGFGIPLASWLARSRGPLASMAGTLVYLPLALPPVTSGILLIYLVGPYTRLGSLVDGRLTDSMAGVVIAQTFVAAPFLVIAARSAFSSLDPALADLAATLGHRPWSRFWTVQIRLAMPGLLAGLLLTWLRALGEYGATVLLAYHPFTLPVFTYVQFSSTGIPGTQAPAFLALVVAVLLVTLSRVRPMRRARRSARPVPVAPAVSAATPVAFDLDLSVGSFRLLVAHRASSHRLAILGASGAGKSLTLKGIGGLLGPDVGTVTYGGRPVGSVPVEHRGLGYVPQQLGLFPGLTVWRQLLYGVDADPALAAWWLGRLGLDDLADRRPEELSGGQRQRASLGQALSRRPRLLLLDEPFSALDAPIRDELRREIRRLQREVGLSTVVVTHDPEEAALLADEVLVLDQGRVLQAGPIGDVYHRPASARVAGLLGIVNVNDARTDASGRLRIGTETIAVSTDVPPNSAVLWSIRPEEIRLDAAGRFAGRCLDVVDVGTSHLITIALDHGPLVELRHHGHVAIEPGAACRVELPAGAVTVWPVASPQ